ncbi:MAG: DUF4340 domain-containing protein [Pedosphaera sp.]|nr:DUF4340 domain-containing protein [Pedosphaera sp.]
MNRKQFIILLVLVVVLGGAGLKYYRDNASSWSSGGTGIGQKLLGNLDVNSVAQISVKQGTNELLLAKKNDLWRVTQRGDYPANFSEIKTLLVKLGDLKIVQTETVGPSQLPRLELATGGQGTNPPTVVELRGTNGAAIKTLLLGKKHLRKGQGASPMGEPDDGGWPDGRWVMAGGAADRVAVVSDPLENVAPKPEDWLNKDFFKIEKARAIAVTFQNVTNSWKLVREKEGADLKFAESKPGEELDSAKAAGVANPFSAPSFADVAVGVKPEQVGLDKPNVVEVATLDGFSYTIKVGAKTNENYFVTMTVAANFPKERTPGKDEKPEDKTKLDKDFADQQKKLAEKLASEKAFEPWTFLVPGWQVDPIVKERAQLLVEKKDEPAPAEKPADEKKDGN